MTLGSGRPLAKLSVLPPIETGGFMANLIYSLEDHKKFFLEQYTRKVAAKLATACKSNITEKERKDYGEERKKRWDACEMRRRTAIVYGGIGDEIGCRRDETAMS
ncbi:Hypothetical predicted protein [Olea europaea subsp. europaea]|uniref:Uncharacterized protein n=1 Tax=Olea europaea subsp. europaea TaxID=158383 RepID=A0A8S0QYE2_OLEEU|nr:Hypothetical predicted protein [Olea europaea subsp. europaea]